MEQRGNQKEWQCPVAARLVGSDARLVCGATSQWKTAQSPCHTVTPLFYLFMQRSVSTSKTFILPLPQQLEDGWVSTLNHFEVNPVSPYFDIQIIRFFDTAFDLARSHPREGVLKYAAGRVTKMLIPKGNVALVEYLLMQCAQ